MTSIDSAPRLLCALASLATLATLAACGGGDGTDGEGTKQPLASPAAAVTTTATATTDRPTTPSASELFDWAETQFPTLFEAGTPTAVADYAGRRYEFRYYAGSNSYLGVADGEVAGLGPFTGNQLQGFGLAQDYACRVFPEVCAGTSIGTLTISGDGVPRAGGGGTFVPVGNATATATESSCVAVGGRTTCTSRLAIGWSESAAERLVVTLSSSYPDRGVAPGLGVNGINLAYSVFGGFGVSQICAENAAAGTVCDFGALGVSHNVRARTLTFTNTPGTVPGGGNVLINGTLVY